ncbi:MAG TPA: GIY-YIG nuclease family protein [Planktothrix sp.]|jgi:putative endonuclease
MFHTYILECADGSLYTGWTNDIENRVVAHNIGKGSKYTRTRLPVEVVASWDFESKSEAMSWEYRIKRMTKSMKLNLIAERKLQKSH